MPCIVITNSPPYPCVLHPWTQPTEVQSEVGESTDAEPKDKEDQLYQAILRKGLEHLWILISVGDPGYQGMTAILAAPLEAGMVVTPFYEKHRVF